MKIINDKVKLSPLSDIELLTIEGGSPGRDTSFGYDIGCLFMKLCEGASKVRG